MFLHNKTKLLYNYRVHVHVDTTRTHPYSQILAPPQIGTSPYGHTKRKTCASGPTHGVGGTYRWTMPVLWEQFPEIIHTSNLELPVWSLAQ